MTIPFYNSRRVVLNNGAVSTIAMTFKAEKASDVHVYACVTDNPDIPEVIELTQGAQYTVSGVGGLGYTVNITNPAAWGDYQRFAVATEYTISQPNDVDVGGPFGQRFEDALDRQTFMLQSMNDVLSRAVLLPVSTPIGADTTLPPAPNQFLAWNDDGTAIVTRPSVDQSTADAERFRDEAREAAEDAVEAAENAADIAAGIIVPIYSTIVNLAGITVPPTVTALRVNGRTGQGDGEGGLFVSANNGSDDTFVSGDGRTWYRAYEDISGAQLLPKGSGGVKRTLAKILTDREGNVAWYGAAQGALASVNRAAVLAAGTANKKIYIPPGQYEFDGPVTLPGGSIVEADGYTKVRWQRKGVWAGDTLTVSGDAQVRGILFEQLHPGFVPGVSTTMADRLTNDQAHIAMVDGTGGLIESCWVSFGVYGVKLLATTRASVRDLHGGGSWDELNGNLCETKNVILLGSTPERPFNTEVSIERFYLGVGNTCVERPLTVGTVTFNTRLGAGCQDAILIEGSEGFHIKGGYLCGNRYGIRLAPKTLSREGTIDDVFIDAPSDTGVYFSSLNGAPSIAVSVRNCKINGQTIAGRAIDVSDVGGASLYGGDIEGNIIMNHTRCPIIIFGGRYVKVRGNTVNNYHCRGGGVGDPAISSGLLVSSVGIVEARDNFYGGGANDWSGANNCQWGEYFGGPANGRTGGVGVTPFGVGGGAIVAGVTPLY